MLRERADEVVASVRGPELRCAACGSSRISVFYEVRDVPVHSCVLLPTREAALAYPTGEVRLGACAACGFIANVAFDPNLLDYGHDYEETQGFSATFNDFARALAGRLIERHDLRSKDVLEIGCGKGEFLALLCELGGNRGVGIDPGYVPERMTSRAAVRFIRDYYTERYADLGADFVCCRHTLEHIQPVAEFVRLVRRSVGARETTTVFFEVPDTVRVLREAAFWDVYHEHCSYFTRGSLARLFRASGFRLLDLSLDFGGQYILLEARAGDPSEDDPLPGEEDLDELEGDIERFRTRAAESVDRWQRRVREEWSRGRRVVVWGSGSKGVAFLTTPGIRDEIEYVVDINPFKHGMHMPGTGQEIVAPEFLSGYRPELVIVMNPIYRMEVQADLDRMGLHPQVAAVEASKALGRKGC